MNQTYPAYSTMPQASLPQVDFSTAGMSGYYNNSSQPIAITPVGASGPRRAGESGNSGFIDLGGGGTNWNPGETTTPSGNHGGEASPVGDVCWPLLLCLGFYLLRHMYLSRRV